MESKILYFEKPGPQNQKKLLEYASIRAKELDINNIVVATTHGNTALAAKEKFGKESNIIAVSIAEGFSMREGWCMTPEERKHLEENGIKVITAGHSLGDV